MRALDYLYCPDIHHLHAVRRVVAPEEHAAFNKTIVYWIAFIDVLLHLLDCVCLGVFANLYYSLLFLVDAVPSRMCMDKH